jgi:hypothetical protein
LALVEAEGSQFGVESAWADTALDDTRGVVEGGDPENQSAQQTQAS